MSPNAPKQQIAILGSTGSIGTQTIDVIRSHADTMCATLLVARRNVDLLASQALELRPHRVVIADDSLRPRLVSLLEGTDIEVLSGPAAIEQAVQTPDIDVVVAAMVGFSGFGPTMAAIQAHKTIALANKETLVVAGQIVMAAARDAGVPILPVDSEHSAIFQCLQGESHTPCRKVILTASGGPFRGMSREQLATVTPQMALHHPNWDMGAKVTIDSASMMNKGLEAIEARWLFNVPASQIDIYVHPQSIVHSLVEFQDGSIKAQLALPDMRLPIQYALTYPHRLPSPVPHLDLASCGPLTFERPDTSVFRNLAIALLALDKGGNAPCIMNGANEVAVAQFLAGNISFLQMTDVVEHALAHVSFSSNPSMQDLYDTDAEARQLSLEFSNSLQ